jgi:hypothetical protein
MTTGRWVVLALGLLLAAGCTIQPAGKRTQSAWVQRELSPAFSTVATADQLGDDWQDEGCRQPVTQLFATLDGRSALLLGRGGTQRWFDKGHLQDLAAEPFIWEVDFSERRAYTVDRATEDENDHLLVRSFPVDEWQHLPATTGESWPGGRIIRVDRHPAGDGLWVCHWPPDGREGLTAVVGRISAAGEYSALAEVTRDPASRRGIEPVALAGGDVLVIAGDWVWHVDAAGSKAEPLFELPTDRSCILSADPVDPEVCWLLVFPEQRGAGTARGVPGNAPGRLVALNTQRDCLTQISTGSVKFVRVYGDWQNRRALLLHPSIGVALANAQTGELSWLLRQSGAAQLQLLPGGQVWAFVPDGIIGIEGDDLIRLAPKLAAEQVLTREQLAQIKPVAEALRWRLDDVQLSPLVHEAGRLTFFNAGEVDADWAEFDWDLSRELVSRLLIARQPESAELKLLGLSDAQLDEQVLAMLSALGWPEAAREAGRGKHNDEELNAFYRLSPEGEAIGEFQLWITSGATMLRLTAAEGSPATQEMPPDDTGAEPAH